MFLKNPQYNSIMRHYDQIQSELRQVMNLRQKEVYDRLPELEQLDKDIVELQASHARQRIMNGMIDSETMRSRIKALESSRTKLLEDAGFPKDYLEPYTGVRIAWIPDLSEIKSVIVLNRRQ